MISLKQIESDIKVHDMQLELSYEYNDKHLIEVVVKLDREPVQSISIMGVKFTHVCRAGYVKIGISSALDAYQCVFSKEVLLDSIGEFFECTK